MTESEILRIQTAKLETLNHLDGDEVNHYKVLYALQHKAALFDKQEAVKSSRECEILDQKQDMLHDIFWNVKAQITALKDAQLNEMAVTAHGINVESVRKNVPSTEQTTAMINDCNVIMQVSVVINAALTTQIDLQDNVTKNKNKDTKYFNVNSHDDVGKLECVMSLKCGKYKETNHTKTKSKNVFKQLGKR